MKWAILVSLLCGFSVDFVVLRNAIMFEMSKHVALYKYYIFRKSHI